jgi:hypothetical protein
LTATVAVLGRAGVTGGRRRRPADAHFLLHENFSEAEAAAGQFSGIIVREKLHPFLAYFSEVNLPCLLAKVVGGHAGTVFGLTALTVRLATAGFIFTAETFLLAALVFLLAAEVFLFTPLLILLAALLSGLSLSLRVSRGLGLTLLG